MFCALWGLVAIRCYFWGIDRESIGKGAGMMGWVGMGVCEGGCLDEPCSLHEDSWRSAAALRAQLLSARALFNDKSPLQSER